MQDSPIPPEQALAEVGLAGFEDNLARRLSAGQNKRLALARLSLSPARLWLLDEPYANLDLDGIALVNRLITQHVSRNGGGAAHHAWRVRGPAGAGPHAGAGRMTVTPTLRAAAQAQLRRDLRLVWRKRGDAMQPMLFAVMVIALFPLALGAEPGMLARIAPGVLWVAVLLAGPADPGLAVPQRPRGRQPGAAAAQPRSRWPG